MRKLLNVVFAGCLLATAKTAVLAETATVPDRACGTAKEHQAACKLVQALKDESNQFVLDAAIKALEAIGPNAGEALAEAVKDEIIWAMNEPDAAKKARRIEAAKTAATVLGRIGKKKEGREDLRKKPLVINNLCSAVQARSDKALLQVAEAALEALGIIYGEEDDASNIELSKAGLTIRVPQAVVTVVTDWAKKAAAAETAMNEAVATLIKDDPELVEAYCSLANAEKSLKSIIKPQHQGSTLNQLHDLFRGASHEKLLSVNSDLKPEWKQIRDLDEAAEKAIGEATKEVKGLADSKVKPSPSMTRKAIVSTAEARLRSKLFAEAAKRLESSAKENVKLVDNVLRVFNDALTDRDYFTIRVLAAEALARMYEKPEPGK